MLAKKILVAPLNWGLGHATRCIPIIKALLQQGFEPMVATDGVALTLLQKEFPTLTFLTLPSYEISYAKKGIFFKWKLLFDSPKMLKAIKKERKLIKKWVKEHELSGIISDNRLGVFSKKIPSVFITHQLNVITGNTTWLSSKIHQYIIKKYTECWVPDVAGTPNLTGKLGHLKNQDFPITYLGPLSRMEPKKLEKKYDLMVLLSGPEPQRSMLEEKLLKEVQRFTGEVLFVKGKMEKEQLIDIHNHVEIHNFMTSEQLEDAIQQSNMVLSRSGYTTVMDLAKLQKKAFFIPTPGQFEQEYLAKKYKKEGLVPYAKQDKFKIELLNEVPFYQGLRNFNTDVNWKKLFHLFEG
ncbi:MAG: glycosyltransferase [Flavobacterium sp.]